MSYSFWRYDVLIFAECMSFRACCFAILAWFCVLFCIGFLCLYVGIYLLVRSKKVQYKTPKLIQKNLDDVRNAWRTISYVLYLKFYFNVIKL